MNVVVYTIGCPQCKVLEAVLTRSKIPYTVVSGKDEIVKRGYSSAPLLEVDGKIMLYKEALEWVRNCGGGQHASE